MKTTTFTDFRRKASSYIDAVEKGETVSILRHGRVVADVVPHRDENRIPAWKRPGLKLDLKGVSLSQEIIREREERDESILRCIGVRKALRSRAGQRAGR
jgi:antitoxin (DNA-binding transcriptional repressor) of toxin-antitoxin stability system